MGIIGYLIGTSIAFFVVMGDLGPPLIASLAGMEPSYNLRLIILTGADIIVEIKILSIVFSLVHPSSASSINI